MTKACGVEDTTIPAGCRCATIDTADRCRYATNTISSSRTSGSDIRPLLTGPLSTAHRKIALDIGVFDMVDPRLHGVSPPFATVAVSIFPRVPFEIPPR